MLLKGKVYLIILLSLCSIFLFQGYCIGEILLDEQIVINLGQSRVIKVKSLDRVAIGDPAVADITVLDDGEQVLITAKQVGHTNLIVWTRGGGSVTKSVRVITEDPKKILEEVKSLLGDMEGISAKIVGDKVIIEGESLTTDDLKKIEHIAKMYKQVENFVTLSSLAKETYVKQINDALAKAGLVSVYARMAGKKIFLEGEVATKKESDNAGLIGRALVENPEENLVNLVKTVAIRTTIKLDVEFIEINVNDLRNIGFKWSDWTNIDGTLNLSSNLGPGKDTHAFTGPISISAATSLRLNTLKTNGDARVLANPTIICGSGQKSSFLAGGEIPIPLITGNNMTVNYKEFGIRLTFEPIANEATKDISSTLEVEVSDVDPSITVMGSPGFSTRRITSSMSTKSGNTVAMSGLVNHNTSKSIERFPGLGDVPVLGELFKSRRFSDKDTELLILVTPTLIITGESSDKEMRREFKEKYDEKGKVLVPYKLMD